MIPTNLKPEYRDRMAVGFAIQKSLQQARENRRQKAIKITPAYEREP